MAEVIRKVLKAGAGSITSEWMKTTLEPTFALREQHNWQAEATLLNRKEATELRNELSRFLRETSSKKKK